LKKVIEAIKNSKAPSDTTEGHKYGLPIISEEEVSGLKFGSEQVPVRFRLLSAGDRSLKMSSIYAKISEAFKVQRLFGVVSRCGSDYLVLENLEDPDCFISLSKAFGLQLQHTSVVQRLRISYELAFTVKSFHSLGYVVRVLSDTSIFLRRTPEDESTDLTPVLAELAHTREVLYFQLKT
jgi:hypothetical protein